MESLGYQFAQKSEVMKVSVIKYHQIQSSGIECEWSPVSQPEFLETLEHAAVHQDVAGFTLYQCLRPGYGLGSAQKCDFHNVPVLSASASAIIFLILDADIPICCKGSPSIASSRAR